jgi:GcrA cell cycle regulator
MPIWQLETSSPELTPPPGPPDANEESCLMHAAKPLRRTGPDQGADGRLKHSKQDRTHHKGINMIAYGATGTSAARTPATRSSATNAAAAGTPAARTPARTSPSWTSERVEQLKSCIGAGLSCSQIAAEIGVTRNAVIGKLNRLGLSRPRNVPGREAEPKREAWRPRILTQHRILMKLPPEPPAGESFIPSGHGCSLLELSPGKCRWPMSEPGTDAFRFCGNSQVEGLPYCGGHARMAYKSAAVRSRGIARP